MTLSITHCTATDAADLTAVRELWESFRSWIGLTYASDQWFVDAYFDADEWRRELGSLPGRYDPSSGGTLLLARVATEPAGAVALRAIDAQRCEMKRLYVADAHRGMGVGDALVKEVIAAGAAAGYTEMVLDTGFRQGRAVDLYRRHGFTETGPYADLDESLLSGSLTFMRRSLVAS